MRACLLCMILAPLVCAQAVYQPRPGDARTCGRVEASSESQFAIKDGHIVGGTVYNQWGWKVLPEDQRKDVGAFSVLDSAGTAHSVSSRKGKVLLIGFWQTACVPSANMLMELAELQPKGEKFGFEAWPVNYDEDRWRKVKPFVDKNKKFFETTRIYLPEIGAKGPSNFVEVIPSLPAVFIVDRKGRLAAQSFGYEPNQILGLLKRILAEN